MIRKRISTQKSKPDIYKTAKYFNREDGCVLFESNIYTPLNSSKTDIASAISQSIESDISSNKRGRKQTVRTQHDVVSYHTDDNLTPEQAKSIAKELYEKTHNLSNRKYALGVHVDTDEIHVHIVWAIKDFDGKCYNKSNDYRIIERECEKLEDKHHLIKPENRISRDIDELDNARHLCKEEKKDIITNKYKNKNPSANERMLEIREITSNKQQMKENLKPYLDNSYSPSDFIYQISLAGFDIIHNGKNSYSIQKDDQTFKASELNLSYKTLKARLGEDLGFEKMLAKKHRLNHQEEECSLISSRNQPDFMNKVNSKSVLMTKFKYEQHSEKVEYFYNTASSKKAFEYYRDPSTVSFNDLSRQSAKAGLQRLLADSSPPSTFTVSGPDFFKKNVWLEFQLMGLESKGFKLDGYKPSPEDLKELKKIQEHYESMNKKPLPKQPEVAIEDSNSYAIPKQPESPTPFKTTEKELVEQDEVFPADHISPEDLIDPNEIEFVEGDYSTYSIEELCDELEETINSLNRRHFIGNSSNDIEGHRHWDSTHRDYVSTKPQAERQQYYLRQEMYEIYDEIESRDSNLAHQLSAEFKESMKYNTRFKPEYK